MCLAEAAYLSFWKVEIPQLLKLSANSLSKAKFPASWLQARIRSQAKLGKTGGFPEMRYPQMDLKVDDLFGGTPISGNLQIALEKMSQCDLPVTNRHDDFP